MTGSDISAELQADADSDADSEAGADTNGDADAPTTLSTEDVYEILSNRRRRYAIHYLKQTGEPVDVSTLAERVAAWENEKPIGELDSQERKRVYISLYQSHLPTLEKRGLVAYDADRGIVELTGSIADAEIYLEDVPWSYFYLGLSLVSGLLVALTHYEVGVLESVPTVAVAFLITVLFGASAVLQTVQTGRMQLGDEGPPPELRAGRNR